MSLEAALKDIERTFGKGSVMLLGDPSAMVPVEVVPTGAATLDIALGVGGLPRGRHVEIYGPEGSGKSTLVLHILSEAQKMGLRVALIDAEHALDPTYARAIGAKPDDFIFSQPSSGEQALSIVGKLVLSGEVGVVAIDSVAALTPQAELDGEMGEAHVGRQARMMGQAMRKLTAHASQTKTLVVWTNQIREKVGVMFGSPETTPGGRALRFYASQRLDVRRISTEGKAGEQTHNRVKVTVKKNRVAAPFRVAEFDIEFGRGISSEGCILDLALERGLVRKSGAFFTIGDSGSLHGREAAKAWLTANPPAASNLYARITEAKR